MLYEHPTWSTALVERMVQRGVDVTPIDVGSSPSPDGAFDLWVNRVNTMPSEGRSPSLVASFMHLLLSLDASGAAVVNGFRCHAIGCSKAAQSALFSRLGLQAPRAVSIESPAAAVRVAEELVFPVLTKPNVGGSGAGIVRHDTLAQLAAAVDRNVVDLGIDGTGLVQEVIPSADGLVHRVEILDGELLYASQQKIQDGFNYCAADGCSIEDGAIEIVEPDPPLVGMARAIVSAASADIAGVEYLIDARSGEPTFYDFNPYSNFVSGRDEELGFSPLDTYIDFLTAQTLHERQKVHPQG